MSTCTSVHLMFSGMPIGLRSEIEDVSDWYRHMYNSLHKKRPSKLIPIDFFVRVFLSSVIN